MASPETPDRASWLQGPSAQCSPRPGKREQPLRLILLVTVAASGSPEEICERTIAALDDRRKLNSARERA